MKYQESPTLLNQEPTFLYTPVMTFERFGAQTGLREAQIRNQITRGNLPGKKVGRLLLVNTAKLLVSAEKPLTTVPVMTAAKFAEVTGLRDQQVISQAENGNLPTTYVGRLRLIDVAEFTRECLEEA